MRRILERARPDLDADFHGRPLGEVLLEPTRIYVKPLLELMKHLPVKGLAHITGGGLVENVPRVLPRGCDALLHGSSWPKPPLFDWLAREGGVDEAEMLRVFNCGIGMAVVVAPGDADKAMRQLAAAGEQVFRIGEIVPAQGAAPQARVV